MVKWRYGELYMGKRVVFKKGYQRKLLEKINSFISVKEMARYSRCSERTIRDWRREKFLADISTLKRLCKKTGIIFPNKDIAAVRDRYWYTALGSHAGAQAVLRKYGQIGGDPIYRRRRWREWWECEGRHKPNSVTKAKSIHIPKKSKELAEFVGIVLGDGSITKNQITVTLHRVDDKEYGEFLIHLVVLLFKIPVGVCQDKKALVTNYSISRVQLVQYCVNRLGLKIGNKVRQQIDIPKWIKQKKNLAIGCVRGLIDTDGSVFLHRYCVGNKEYAYKKLQFVSRSEPLRQSVFQILQGVGLTVRLGKRYDIWIDSQKELRRYFEIIGSHNPKHLKRYQN